MRSITARIPPSGSYQDNTLPRGRIIRTASFCRFSPAVSYRRLSRGSAPALVASSIPVGRLRSVCTGCFRYQHQERQPNTRTPRGNTQYTLHCAVRPPLHRPPAPPLHCGPAPRSETACLGSLGSRVRFARRARHIVLPALLHPLRYGRSPRPRLWATSLHCATSGVPSSQRACRAYRLRIRSRLRRSGRLRGITRVPAQASTA